jgi:hypothetical protein
MKKAIISVMRFTFTVAVAALVVSCEEDVGYCFKCKDEFATETFCYEDFKEDYTKEEFKQMVFNLEDFGFKCKRDTD